MINIFYHTTHPVHVRSSSRATSWGTLSQAASRAKVPASRSDERRTMSAAGCAAVQLRRLRRFHLIGLSSTTILRAC